MGKPLCIEDGCTKTLLLDEQINIMSSQGKIAIIFNYHFTNLLNYYWYSCFKTN